jgi:hypothetical protein
VAGLATAEMVRADGIDWNYFGEMSNTVRFGKLPHFVALLHRNTFAKVFR